MRVVLALILALLTLPLGAIANAEDLPSGGEATEGQVLGTTSEEAPAGGQDGPTGESAPAEESAAEKPAAEEALVEEGAAEAPAPEPVPDSAREPGSAKAVATSTSTGSGGNKLTGPVASAVQHVVALASFTASDLESAPYDPADEQGANDEPGQKDLTKLWAWSPSGGVLKIGWNWDETGWSGKNTGDACALFDTDQDTDADYAVCVTVGEDPAVQLEPGSPRVYKCTTQGTNSSTNCLGAELITGTSTTCEVAQTATNPFVAGGMDTTALCTISLADVGGSGSTVLTNICTYPSQQPTSDDSDCVLAPRDAKLTVKKVATPADTGQLFTFNLTTKGVEQQFAQLPAGGSYSAGVSSADDANLSLAEAVPEGWQLESATCDNGQSPDKLNLESGEHVTCTFTNSKRRYSDLVVSKTATPSFDRDYDWTIKKSVDKTRQAIPEGSSATFDYSVLVTPSAPKDSGFAVAGKITVTNPNAVDITGVTVTDAIPGGECSVKDGQGVTIPANDSVELGYSCSLQNATATTTGTNTATATWKASDWYGTTGSAEGSRGFDFADAKSTVTDGSVTVSDDQYDLSKGGTVDTEVKAADGPKTFTYSMTRRGKAGECSTYPNTAKITERDGGTQTSSKSVEVCVGKDLVVSKVAALEYARAYSWDIDKDVDATSKEVDPETGKATFTYEVTAEAKSYTDDRWVMSGTIKVTNPNTWQAVTLDSIVDATDVGGGARCIVDDDAGLVIPKDSYRVFDYACTFSSQPSYTGKNTATVTWDKDAYATPSGTASGQAAVAADDDSVKKTNRTITVVDDKTDPDHPVTLGTVTWKEGLKKEFTYSLALPGRPGTCVDYRNKAWIEETHQSASRTVEVCAPAELEVSKTAYASYDRTYLWDIEKDVDKTRVVVQGDGSASFLYTVRAIPNGYVETGHEIHGDITVANPNDYKDVTVDITDSVDLPGVTCTVTDGTDVTVPAGDDVTRSYTCQVSEIAESDYGRGVNTALVTWSGGSAKAYAAVKFTLDGRMDRVVEVTDDKVTRGSNPEVLGTASWNKGVQEFHYTLKLDGVEGRCTGYTNTATIVETGQQAQAQVEVCGKEILPVEEEPPAKPRPPALLPQTGAPSGIGLWSTLGGLMVALGAALLMRRRRETS